MSLASKYFLLATLAVSVVADQLVVSDSCPTTADREPGCKYRNAAFITDFGSYAVDGRCGCKTTTVPSMTELCIDWANNRAHFKFNHQESKRCLSRTKRVVWNGPECPDHYCNDHIFEEVSCTWRELPAEGGGDASVAAICY